MWLEIEHEHMVECCWERPNIHINSHLEIRIKCECGESTYDEETWDVLDKLLAEHEEL